MHRAPSPPLNSHTLQEIKNKNKEKQQLVHSDAEAKLRRVEEANEKEKLISFSSFLDKNNEQLQLKSIAQKVAYLKGSVQDVLRVKLKRNRQERVKKHVLSDKIPEHTSENGDGEDVDAELAFNEEDEVDDYSVYNDNDSIVDNMETNEEWIDEEADDDSVLEDTASIGEEEEVDCIGYESSCNASVADSEGEDDEEFYDDLSDDDESEMELDNEAIAAQIQKDLTKKKTVEWKENGSYRMAIPNLVASNNYKPIDALDQMLELLNKKNTNILFNSAKMHFTTFENKICKDISIS